MSSSLSQAHSPLVQHLLLLEAVRHEQVSVAVCGGLATDTTIKKDSKERGKATTHQNH